MNYESATEKLNAHLFIQNKKAHLNNNTSIVDRLDVEETFPESGEYDVVCSLEDVHTKGRTVEFLDTVLELYRIEE